MAIRKTKSDMTKSRRRRFSCSPQFLQFATKLGGSPVDLTKRPNAELLDAGIAYAQRHFASDILRSTPLRNKQGALFRPEFHYIAGITGDRAVNAVIEKVDDVHCVAVFEAMQLPFDEISRFMFSRRDVFTFIGNPGEEQQASWPTTVALGLSSWTSKNQSSHTELMEFLAPRCPVRREFCGLFSATMLKFVWFHEFGHGTEGHADFIQSMFGAAPLFEIEDSQSPVLGLSKPNRQIIELAADERAGELLLSKMMLDHLSTHTIMGTKLTPAEWAAFTFIAIIMVNYCLCMIETVRDKRDVFKFDKTAEYPTSFIRLCAQIFVLASRRYAEREEIQAGIQLALKEVDVMSTQHEHLGWVLSEIRNRNVLIQVGDYLTELAKKTTVVQDIEEKFRFVVNPSQARGRNNRTR